MDEYLWAGTTRFTAQLVPAAQAAGHEPALYLRALLSAVVERSKQERSTADLQELQFLAENLDDGRDYGFMRP